MCNKKNFKSCHITHIAKLKSRSGIYVEFLSVDFLLKCSMFVVQVTAIGIVFQDQIHLELKRLWPRFVECCRKHRYCSTFVNDTAKYLWRYNAVQVDLSIYNIGKVDKNAVYGRPSGTKRLPREETNEIALFRYA